MGRGKFYPNERLLHVHHQDGHNLGGNSQWIEEHVDRLVQAEGRL